MKLIKAHISEGNVDAINFNVYKVLNLQIEIPFDPIAEECGDVLSKEQVIAGLVEVINNMSLDLNKHSDKLTKTPFSNESPENGDIGWYSLT